MVTKAQKVQKVEDLKAILTTSQLAIVSDYQGTTVDDITKLRRGVQAAGGDLTVAKNTLLKLAVQINTAERKKRELENVLWHVD